MCDSKMINDNAKYVEFDVKPAVKTWFKSKNKNLGLAVLTEDQENNVIETEKLIKGASCTVGTCECVH